MEKLVTVYVNNSETLDNALKVAVQYLIKIRDKISVLHIYKETDNQTLRFEVEAYLLMNVFANQIPGSNFNLI